jgi:hypothetical protein
MPPLAHLEQILLLVLPSLSLALLQRHVVATALCWAVRWRPLPRTTRLVSTTGAYLRLLGKLVAAGCLGSAAILSWWNGSAVEAWTCKAELSPPVAVLLVHSAWALMASHLRLRILLPSFCTVYLAALHNVFLLPCALFAVSEALYPTLLVPLTLYLGSVAAGARCRFPDARGMALMASLGLCTFLFRAGQRLCGRVFRS